MNGADWFNDPRFERFRAYYQHGRHWYQQHQIAYWKARAQAAIYENQQLHHLLQNVCECSAKFESLPQPPSTSNQNIPRVTTDVSETFHEDTSTEDKYEMEISDEMLEFFAQSMKHKQERKEYERQNEVSYVNVDDIPLESRSVDIFGVSIPDENIKDEKMKLYKHLYGEKADRIYAMETAMELTFHRNCDLKQPKLWPNMPLKL